ncbi:MAG: serine--tRNA ligase [Euryarchaeota archaeon]|nr:serine--tRNA ligase [Euryarchaeota archaeon]
MLDIKLFRETPDVVRADLDKRGRDPSAVDEVIGLDQAWRDALKRLEELRAERNRTAKEIPKVKGTPEGAALLARMKQVSAEIGELENNVEEAIAKRDTLLRRLPNLMHESVPVGKDDTENVEVRRWGKCEPHPFEAVSHVDLLESLDVADIERAARVAGARFFYLKNELVLISQALAQFALASLVKKGYTAIEPPYMLRREAIEGATDLADFEEVIYKIEDEDLYLIATSEHALGAYHMDEILNPDLLPLKYVGVSPCFRKEAGAHGKDTRGIFRVHQFQKVEQFVFSDPQPKEGAPGEGKTSWDLHEELIQNAEELYQALEIPYRIVNICTGDLGTVAAKKYDMEAWMPVQGTFREVVSCSNCTDYQARRWNIRTRDSPGKETRIVHTLNSTAIATQRTLVALLENHQQADGSVKVPEALQPYCGGLEVIRPRSVELQG